MELHNAAGHQSKNVVISQRRVKDVQEIIAEPPLLSGGVGLLEFSPEASHLCALRSCQVNETEHGCGGAACSATPDCMPIPACLAYFSIN